MPDLIETVEDGVAILTLNRPENLNALSDEIRLGLLESLQRLGADTAIGCIVLTGAGRGFCAGGDVKTMGGRSASGVRGTRRRRPAVRPHPDADAQHAEADHRHDQRRRGRRRPEHGRRLRHPRRRAAPLVSAPASSRSACPATGAAPGR